MNEPSVPSVPADRGARSAVRIPVTSGAGEEGPAATAAWYREDRLSWEPSRARVQSPPV